MSHTVLRCPRYVYPSKSNRDGEAQRVKVSTSRRGPSELSCYLSNIEPGYTEAVGPVRAVYNHGWLIGDEQAISLLAQAEIDTVLEVAPRTPAAGEQALPPPE